MTANLAMNREIGRNYRWEDCGMFLMNCDALYSELYYFDVTKFGISELNK